jgi:uroporphyrinogen-III synthase
VSANTIDKNWKNYPCIAIGGATKSKIEALGGEVIYYPKAFYGKNLSQDIKAYFADKKILYLRPKEISFNSKAYLAQEGITLKEQIIYETSCVRYDTQTIEKNATIIFTSPSTIKCFFKNFIWDNSFVAVLIGEATKEHLPSYCQYVVADEPLIDACVKKAKELEKN